MYGRMVGYSKRRRYHGEIGRKTRLKSCMRKRFVIYAATSGTSSTQSAQSTHGDAGGRNRYIIGKRTSWATHQHCVT